MTTETQGAPARRLSIMDATHAFAVPGEAHLIDCIHPATGRSWINDEDLEQIRQRYPLAEIVELEAWTNAKAAEQDRPFSLVPTTKDKYWEMLCVLPPEDQLRGGFLVGEPWDHHARSGRPRFACYVQSGDKFHTTTRPLTRVEFQKLMRGIPQEFGAVRVEEATQ